MEENDFEQILKGDKEFTIVVDVRKNAIIWKVQTDDKEYSEIIDDDSAMLLRNLMKTVAYTFSGSYKEGNIGSDKNE